MVSIKFHESSRTNQSKVILVEPSYKYSGYFTWAFIKSISQKDEFRLIENRKVLRSHTNTISNFANKLNDLFVWKKAI